MDDIYHKGISHYKTDQWPNGVPAVFDGGNILVCLCPHRHGGFLAMNIASALNLQSRLLAEGDEHVTSD